MPAASGVAVPVAVDIQPPAPGWPPVGLAGLLGFADEAEPVASGGAQTMPPLLAGGPPAGASAVTAAMPATVAPMLPAQPIDDAAVTATGLLPEPSAMAEGGEPAPVAFTLPAPVALREPPPLLAAPLPTPEVGADDFDARFGAQIEWMASQKLSEARIRVTPNDLGPVEVRLHLDGDRIRADFVSANAETRQALEHGLPRLRDLLGEHGFQLAHAGVGAGGSDARGGATSTAANPGDGSGTGPAEATPAAPQRRSLGLLDAYA
ncbi:flagellar hook-length control protein FliK [Luteimonas chenhongjianii]|nr:flagellar hook-length control protein FliK [Luteimonas chenhongjianii]